MADLVPYTVLLYGLKRTGREFPLYTYIQYPIYSANTTCRTYLAILQIVNVSLMLVDFRSTIHT